MRKWEDLPEYMKCDEVKEYYDILSKKKFSLKMKRAFDLVAGTGVLIVTAIPMLIISVKIADRVIMEVYSIDRNASLLTAKNFGFTNSEQWLPMLTRLEVQ